jgi:F0F1-type ATP synthase beta subunit
MLVVCFRTISETTALEQISKTLKTQRSQEEKMFAELSELGKTQTDQVVRTVAYSTNQVIKLHQDVMNISNALMVANCGGSPSNGTTTINATVSPIRQA